MKTIARQAMKVLDYKLFDMEVQVYLLAFLVGMILGLAI